MPTGTECVCGRNPHHPACPVYADFAGKRERFFESCLLNVYVKGVKTLDTLQANGEGLQRAIDAGRRWARGGGTSWLLFVSGEPGTGKTHVAAATLALAIVEYGQRGRYTKLARMLMEISDAPLGERVITFEKYSKAKRLVIDEVGAEKASSFTISMLSQVLDERYDAKRPTIITSNLTLDELGDKWSPSDEVIAAQRIVDRIYEMTGGKSGEGRIRFDGKSWRKR